MFLYKLWRARRFCNPIKQFLLICWIGSQIKKSPNPGQNKAVAYVRFSTEDEADRAEWAGPHYIGGDVEVKRVISPKVMSWFYAWKTLIS